MGIPQLLVKLLQGGNFGVVAGEFSHNAFDYSSGRTIDLRQFAVAADFGAMNQKKNDNDNDYDDEEGEKKLLRVAVDISGWLYKASQGYGTILADERHLENYGRAELLHEQFQQDENNNSHNNGGGTCAAEANFTRTNVIQPPRPPPALLLPKHEHARRLEKYTQKCVEYCLTRLQRLCQVVQVLVVLDGMAPPMKRSTTQERRNKRALNVAARDEPPSVVTVATGKDFNKEAMLKKRIQAFRRAGAGNLYHYVMDWLIQALRDQEIPFLVAPYESDGQLAYLAQEITAIDLIITEDSDLIAYTTNACPILYKTIDQKKKKMNFNSKECSAAVDSENDIDDSPEDAILVGKLLRRQDWGVVTNGDLQLGDFSPAMMAVLFVAAGSDYCPSLKGIGLVTASHIVHQAFYSKPSPTLQHQGDDDDDDDGNQPAAAASSTVVPPLRRVLDQLYQKCRDRHLWKKNSGDKSDAENGGDNADDDANVNSADAIALRKQKFEDDFLKAVIMFRHSTVFCPIQGKCVIRNQHKPDAELLSYAPYRALLQDWPRLQETAIGKLVSPPQVACLAAEGWISWKAPHKFRGGQEKEASTAAGVAASGNGIRVPKYVRDFVHSLRRQQQQEQEQNQGQETNDGKEQEEECEDDPIDDEEEEDDNRLDTQDPAILAIMAAQQQQQEQEQTTDQQQHDDDDDDDDDVQEIEDDPDFSFSPSQPGLETQPPM